MTCIMLALLSVVSSLAVATENHGEELTVAFPDLDLATEAGNETLYTRIRVDAQWVCRGLEDRDLKRRQHYRNCVDGAILKAIEKVGSPGLTACYESHNRTRKIAVASAGDARTAKVK